MLISLAYLILTIVIPSFLFIIYIDYRKIRKVNAMTRFLKRVVLDKYPYVVSREQFKDDCLNLIFSLDSYNTVDFDILQSAINKLIITYENE